MSNVASSSTFPFGSIVPAPQPQPQPQPTPNPEDSSTEEQVDVPYLSVPRNVRGKMSGRLSDQERESTLTVNARLKTVYEKTQGRGAAKTVTQKIGIKPITVGLCLASLGDEDRDNTIVGLARVGFAAVANMLTKTEKVLVDQGYEVHHFLDQEILDAEFLFKNFGSSDFMAIAKSGMPFIESSAVLSSSSSKACLASSEERTAIVEFLTAVGKNGKTKYFMEVLSLSHKNLGVYRMSPFDKTAVATGIKTMLSWLNTGKISKGAATHGVHVKAAIQFVTALKTYYRVYAKANATKVLDDHKAAGTLTPELEAKAAAIIEGAEFKEAKWDSISCLLSSCSHAIEQANKVGATLPVTSVVETTEMDLDELL